MASADVEHQLAAMPLFSNLTADLLGIVAAEVETRTLPAGTTLFQIGDDGDELFIVVDGCVEIYLPVAGGGEEVVAELTAGRWFGEMALITGEPRSASARTRATTRVLVMSRSSFHSLLGRVPGLALTLSQELSRRLRSRLLQQSSGTAPRLIVVEDATATRSSAAAAERLALAIADELAEPVGVIDLAPRQAAMQASALQSRVELLPTPSSLTDVNAAVAAKASVLLRVDAQHPLGDAVRSVPGAQLSPQLLHEIAALGDAAAAPGIVATPLQCIVRRLLHRRVALVLGAGGAKGLAHIGAVRCFERAGLRFDMIAGTSIGGVVAGLLAMGWDSERALDLGRRVRDNFRGMLLDFGVPSGSLLRGDKKRRLFERETAGCEIRSLPVPFAVVAADLVSGREVVLNEGPLYQALDATTAIPTVFPPVVSGDRVLVDGWVVNPFPSDIVRRAGADIVIGVDPNVGDEVRPPRPATQRRRGRWRRWLDPRRLIDPAGIVRVAMRAMDVGARERALA